MICMKLALLAISGKPYHAGHHSLVTRASNENDLVLVFVSYTSRGVKVSTKKGQKTEGPMTGEVPVFGQDMAYIWENLLLPNLVIKSNTKIIPPSGLSASPIRNVYDTIDKLYNSIKNDDKFVVVPFFNKKVAAQELIIRCYSDDVDIDINFPDERMRQTYNAVFDAKNPPKIEKIGVSRNSTINISGTKMRQFLLNDDRESFQKLLPPLPADVSDQIYGILSKSAKLGSPSTKIQNESFSLLKSFVKMLVEQKKSEKTARLSDLTKDDILDVLSDILGNESLRNYTEKMAGQHLSAKIEGGEVLAKFKSSYDDEFKKTDIAGVVKFLNEQRLFDNFDEGTSFSFEIIKSHDDSRPDYLDYMSEGKTIVVEYSGILTKQIAEKLTNSSTRYIFFTKTDINKSPKKLSAELHQKITDSYNFVANAKKIDKSQKQEIEDIISRSLSEIFGESILGGPSEGVFVTGASKNFKIPDENYAQVQRIQAPIYAVFSRKGKMSSDELAQRFLAVAEDPSLIKTDKLYSDVKRYLTYNTEGNLKKGYRTFFTVDEAQSLLDDLDNVIKTADTIQAKKFVSKIRSRASNPVKWVST